MAPSPSKEAIYESMMRFDAELRSHPEWSGWELRPNYRFAIEHEGRRYPVKQIVSMASGQAVSSFSGGAAGANRVVEQRGFTVVPIGAIDGVAESSMERFREALGKILAGYLKASGTKYSGDHDMIRTFEEARDSIASFPGVVVPRAIRVVASAGKGNWASVPWLSLLDPRETTTTQQGVYIVYLFRADMSGIYVTLNQGVTELKDLSSADRIQELTQRVAAIREHVPELQNAGFAFDDAITLASKTSLGASYESSTIAHKFYPSAELPSSGDLADDLQALLNAYDNYIDRKPSKSPESVTSAFDLGSAFGKLVEHVTASGFVFAPWQLAAYVSALRTKPFVILAGISGTGKSRLPQLVAEATGARFRRVSVRPDWTDSSEVLGYNDLQSRFRPGSVLEFARTASESDTLPHVCLLDEMNLARVEQYSAELLSGMEDRRAVDSGGYASPPLLTQKLNDEDATWGMVGWPSNLSIVGTVNMDETTHGFSRKVLDRAFTLEMSDVDLRNWKKETTQPAPPNLWPASAWYPRATRLGELTLTTTERALVKSCVDALTEANGVLSHAQAQVGYRVRDEVSLFVLHAQPLLKWFRTQAGDAVDPLDLAINMKVLPRISGGSGQVRHVVLHLLGWALRADPSTNDDELEKHASDWVAAGRPVILKEARFPFSAARLCLMWERLQQEGFTSYWL